MSVSDLVGRFLGRRQPKPAGMMSRFEVTGLHELSSSIEFRRDTASNLLVLFFVTLAAFLMVSMWVGTFSKQETMRGIVLGSKGSQRLAATVDGTVTKVWVAQGDEVKVGQRLLTIVPQQSSAGAKPLSEAELQSLTEQRQNIGKQIADLEALMSNDAADLGALEGNVVKINENLRKQEAELTMALTAQDSLVRKLQAYLKLGDVTRDVVIAQERIKQDYTRQLLDIRLQGSQLASTQIERRRTVQQSKSANANERAQLTRGLADLDSRIERAKSAIATDVISGTAGRIAALNVREGSDVKLGDTIAAIGDPDATFTIGLQAPSKTMGLLALGQRVVLKYDAFPYKTFGIKHGRIIAIGRQPLSLPKDDDSSAMADLALAKAGPRPPKESKFLIEVEPEDRTIMAYGAERPVLIGSTLSADIVVERRRLIDWVLDPIFAMRGRT
ncbi:HlyD family secretion protein [Methylobacterium haplocladii]|uniref:Toxin secretion, membrane fusion protein n=1 Tax=Methylobacterium haplocladii TaxID=1176176 RepID=A0A512IML6_9HYPH|nr:biotin/lipoyl-binding protein [Methylobacterium haplocladii]GEO98953.1 toxin secretion, membrane fusion protein [Methylobacterium haplocladii]GJD84200.1 Colicin V secretion protein CvaA [Methylobacterium haplocladii]GLS59811.1 toxin secretion, membrane fusion protein [Methylobacterium haplocladii]